MDHFTVLWNVTSTLVLRMDARLGLTFIGNDHKVVGARIWGTLSLPRVINFKLPLQPHQDNITQYWFLTVSLRWKNMIILPILSTSLTRFFLKDRENVFWNSQGMKGLGRRWLEIRTTKSSHHALRGNTSATDIGEYRGKMRYMENELQFSDRAQSLLPRTHLCEVHHVLCVKVKSTEASHMKGLVTRAVQQRKIGYWSSTPLIPKYQVRPC